MSPSRVRCASCGSSETFEVDPQGLAEWALQRLLGGALSRCHDCGRRQGLVALAPALGAAWGPGRALLRAGLWATLLLGTALVVVSLLRRADRPEEQDPIRVPREPPRRDRDSPAPSPP